MHGTTTSYTRGCRCDACREANADYHRLYKERRRGGPTVKVDQARLSDLLHELFPNGLTDDCPARRALR